MHHTGNVTMCPVIAWACIICQICSISGTSADSPVCTYRKADGTLGLVTSKQVLDRICNKVTAIGKDILAGV